MSIKLAIVGTGWVAGEYIKAIHSHPETELYGIVSGNKERAAGILSDNKINARIFSNYEEMVRDPEVDAIVLCSMPDVRAEQAILAAQFGKHLVIEKPIAMNKAELWKMEEAITKSGIKTVVSFVLRWNPSFDTTKALINDDAIGRIFMAQIDYWHNIGPHYGQYRWNSKKEIGGSSILSAGCHAVDAVRYFAGEIEEVSAFSCQTWSDSKYEYDPNALAIFKLSNGGLGKVSSSIECKTTYKFNIHLLGEKGAIMNNQLFSHKLPGQVDYATIPTILPDSGDVTHHPFAEEIKEFVQAIQQGTIPRSDFFDACKTMEVCFAIDESISSGNRVALAK